MTSKSESAEDAKVQDAVFADLNFPNPTVADGLAGISVALVLIPQSLAYATIAGMSPIMGLYSSAIPLLVFSIFASSPYLQTGPVATTSLLTLAALTSAQFTPSEYVAAGTMLALMVGVIRIALGLSRLGWVAYLMSDPVMIGFTSAAAIIIMCSQFPKCVGVPPQDLGAVGDAIWAVSHPLSWSLGAVILSLITVCLMAGGRKIHRLFPGVLFAVLIGFAAAACLRPYVGPLVGTIPTGLLNFNLSFPWDKFSELILASLVIASVGFAEPSAIARLYANEDNSSWNANREFFSSGLANIASAFVGGYPVGGSFSRSSVNRISGAKTRWSGAVTGLCVLVFLNFASVLTFLPYAVLGGIVVAAVYRLTKPRRMLFLWWRSPIQAALAWTTFVATLVFTPHIHWAIFLGVGLSFAIHFLKKFEVRIQETNESELTARPEGLMWFATQNSFQEQLVKIANDESDKDIALDLGDLISLDVNTIETITGVAKEIHPRKVRVFDSPMHSDDLVRSAISRATKTLDEHRHES